MSRTKDLDSMLGDPKRAILSMTLPLIVSYLIVQINMFVDTSWCSGLGSDASSAVSSISPVYWIIAGLGTGIGVGASTAIARCLGKDDKVRADSMAAQTVVMSLIIALITGPILIVLIDPMVDIIGARSISDLCNTYILPICIMTP
ncbi:MAG: MATE family efflux transporter [Candidatus Methanomethylophilaceae archaeon]